MHQLSSQLSSAEASSIMKVKVKSLSLVQLFATPWTVAHQAPPSMEFSRQEYWTGLPFPSPGDLPDSGIEPRSPALQADALLSEPPPYNSFSTFQPWWTFKKANQIMLPSCSIIHALPKHLKSKLLPMAYMVLCDLIPAYPFDFIPYHSLLFSLHSAHISPTSISWFHHSQKKKKIFTRCLSSLLDCPFCEGWDFSNKFFLEKGMNSTSMHCLHKAFPVLLGRQYALILLEFCVHISFNIYHFPSHVIVICVCVLSSQTNCDIRMGRIPAWFIWIFPTWPTIRLCTEPCW